MKSLSLVLLLALLGACASSTTTRLHSLLPPPATGASTATVAAARGWELAPVQLPAQVDRPQWVLRRADDSLQVLEHERWIAPLGDEIHAAVAARLAGGGPPLRITLDVQRFDAALGRYSRVEAAWTVRQGDGRSWRCQATLSVQPAGDGVPALAAAHRALFAQLGDRIAASFSAC